MMYLLSNFAGWLIAAFVLGGLVSLFACRGRGACAGWPFALGLFVVGLVVALLKLLPGRAGLWLETALLLSAAYALGCLLGCWLASLLGLGASAAASASTTARAPALLAAPRGGRGEDLRLIQGVGPLEEQALNAQGVFHYDQVAAWDAGNVAWASSLFGAPGRVEAEQWAAQARVLAAGRDTDYSVLLRVRRALDDAQALTPVPPPAPLAVAPARTEASAAAAAPQAAEEGPPAPPVEGEDAHEGSRPRGLLGARGGKADDLKLIKGIGPQNEGRLHGLGIWHFDQIAAWTRDEVLWVGSYLAFPGRIDRENWLEQARLLAEGVETEFAKRAAAGLVPTSKDDGSRGQANVAKVETSKH